MHTINTVLSIIIIYYKKLIPLNAKTPMRSFLIFCVAILLSVTFVHAQATREVHGTVIDSTKQSVPGAIVKCINSTGDSVLTAANADGKFVFAAVKGPKFTLVITSIGYQGLIRHFTLDNDTKPVNLDPIILKVESNVLSQVNITAINPVVMKEDTVEYKASAYPVRANAPVEDVLKKLPGVDVDANGNVTAQGKQVTKVRINGKDFFGGDVQTATKNLPADVIENIQMIDDYGDQANLTGVKTGEPDKIMNITIRKDKNYGYSMQGTGGDGKDWLPAAPNVTDENRYVGNINSFVFDGDRQIAVLGSINNTNANLFNFGSAGGGGGFGGGGGGRGNALRGGASSSLATTANGITNARSIGTNFRDQWGKDVSAYGSYSFTDNSTFTQSINNQTNYFQRPSTSLQNSIEHDNPINHRFNFNIEYKPDTLNYLKVTPTFSYGSTNTQETEDNTYKVGGEPNLVYNSNSVSNSSSPSYGLTALYNHRFKAVGRNFSANFSVNSSKNSAYDNPIYHIASGTLATPAYQEINTDSRTTTYSATFSYLEPLSKRSFLELSYAYSHSHTSSDKATDTLAADTDFFVAPPVQDDSLSNNYAFSFITHRVGLNYRFVEKKYNYTLGIAAAPSILDGQSILPVAPQTHQTTFNIVPTARFVYNFSRGQSLSFNYNGSPAQPSFSQLQPVTDFSNALYPVQGNPDLKPSFSNNISFRYNKFSFATGNIIFVGAFFTQTNNQVVTNIVSYPGSFTAAALADKPTLNTLRNTNLITYINANGYYTGTAFFAFSKPWDERKYTLSLNGNVSYVNNIGYSSSVDSTNTMSMLEKNVAKNLVFTPNVRFRVDLTDVIDAQANVSYSAAKTTNSVNEAAFGNNSNFHTLTLALNGKNYFWKDWTLFYDITRVVNYGYASNLNVTNPNILNLYVERRFLKDNRATIRLSAFDLFNQNNGVSTQASANSITQSNINRLGRYYLATFTFRLQKFAGKAPAPDAERGFRRHDGGGPGGGGPRGGGGF